MLLRVPDPRAWPSRLVGRYLVVLFVLTFAIVNYALWHTSSSWEHVTRLRAPLSFGSLKHPIVTLMRNARESHEKLLNQRSYDIYSAASHYRARRGRHPPPGFDQWFQAASQKDAVVIEEFFDRIYKDLEPFWSLDTEQIKKRANAWPWAIKVRNGKAYGDGDVEGRVPWMQLWTGIIKEFARHLPDVDMPINMMDEPRLLVPYDKISELVEQALRNRTMPKVADATTTYKGLAYIDAANIQPYQPKWFDPKKSYWDLAVKTCGPNTTAYGVEAMKDYAKPAEFPTHYEPEYAYKGYVQNWTAAMDPCAQPHLRQLHGSFVGPISLSSADELIPLFGGSKLTMNNEILIPGAMYLTQDAFYSGGDTHGPEWSLKKDGIVWRGDANGGHTNPKNWHHFQRHRLVDMLNGTSVSRAEKSPDGRAKAFKLADTSIYKSALTSRRTLGDWLGRYADVAFVHLCPPKQCNWIFHFFSEKDSIPMKEQYEYKFLPDADGNSFSARFRGFMLSTSAPLKATIYAEWHDDRLVPWLHFIPLDNTFQDLHPVLEYFADGNGQGDAAAQLIAEKGKVWAEQVLRRDDMALYMWRLLLEWARVCDENRATLGFVKDLKR